MRRINHLCAPPLAAVVLLALAACGDDDGGAESGGDSDSGGPPVSLEGTVSDHGTGEVEGDELELELDDNYFGPTYVRGTPGQQVRIELVNEGDASHTFTSDALGVDEALDAGGSSSVTVTLPDEGAVEFHCRFHEGQGMKGAFFFGEGDPVDAG